MTGKEGLLSGRTHAPQDFDPLRIVREQAGLHPRPGISDGKGRVLAAPMHSNMKHCFARDGFGAVFCYSEERAGLHRIDKYLARAFWYTVRELLWPMRDSIPRLFAGSALGQRFGHRKRRRRFSLDQRFCRSRAQSPVPRRK